MQVDHDSTEKTVRPTAHLQSTIASRKPTTPTMVTSSTLLAPKSSSPISRNNSNGSTSLAQEETSSDSLFSPTSSHYVIKCNVNPSGTTTNVTPRVKVTVQQPSITMRSSNLDSSTDSLSPAASSNLFLKTPSTRLVTTSAPEFSVSGASSVEDSDDLTSFEQYQTSAHSPHSNPSPELRKNSFDDWVKLEQRYLPRSKSEINTLPTDESTTTSATSQIKPVNSIVDLFAVSHFFFFVYSFNSIVRYLLNSFETRVRIFPSRATESTVFFLSLSLFERRYSFISIRFSTMSSFDLYSREKSSPSSSIDVDDQPQVTSRPRENKVTLP